MPFVRVLWKESMFDSDDLARLASSLPGIVARTFSEFDPDHVVGPEMVDVRVEAVGRFDVLHTNMLVTVLARSEEARRRCRRGIVEDVTRGVQDVGCPPDTMVELVLTDRTSTYEYRKAGP